MPSAAGRQKGGSTRPNPFWCSIRMVSFVVANEEDKDMLKRSLLTTLFVMLAVAVAPSVFAQTSLDIKNGVIAGVWNNTLVITDGNVSRQFDVPSDFMVNVDGKPTALKDLRPGMHITALIKTTSNPVVVQTTELRNARYLKRAGAIVFTREADGIHQYTVPAGFRFWINDHWQSIDDLQSGTIMNATIVHTGTATGTTQEIAGASATDPAAKAAADKAAADKAAAD